MNFSIHAPWFVATTVLHPFWKGLTGILDRQDAELWFAQINEKIPTRTLIVINWCSKQTTRTTDNVTVIFYLFHTPYTTLVDKGLFDKPCLDLNLWPSHAPSIKVLNQTHGCSDGFTVVLLLRYAFKALRLPSRRGCAHPMQETRSIFITFLWTSKGDSNYGRIMAA